ncbi:MAG: chalcone isomerase family protein [Gammaproteobacteria bacterium]|jgi:hypothetical protein
MIALLALVLQPVPASVVLPPAVTQSEPQLRPLGSGVYTRFFFDVYRARLWSPAEGFSWSRPFALQIHYLRDIKGEALVDASIDQMRRLGFRDPATLEQWREFMGAAFPDVRKGDEIVGLYQPGVATTFYHNGMQTERVSDPEFGRAFFDIWLAPETSAPELRRDLLGMRRGR